MLHGCHQGGGGGRAHHAAPRAWQPPPAASLLLGLHYHYEGSKTGVYIYTCAHLVEPVTANRSLGGIGKGSKAAYAAPPRAAGHKGLIQEPGGRVSIVLCGAVELLHEAPWTAVSMLQAAYVLVLLRTLGPHSPPHHRSARAGESSIGSLTFCWSHMMMMSSSLEPLGAVSGCCRGRADVLGAGGRKLPAAAAGCGDSSPAL